MKTIKLKPKTVERLSNVDSQIKTLESVKSNIFLTILEDKGIDLAKYEISYDNGEITLKDKK